MSISAGWGTSSVSTDGAAMTTRIMAAHEQVKTVREPAPRCGKWLAAPYVTA